jgi:integrase
MRGGIEPRGDRTWRITVAAGRDPITGRYVRIRETFHGTKTDAARRREELRVQVRRGTVARVDRETVAEFLERWIAHREHVGKVRPKVAATYRGYVRREIAPRIGALRIAEVRPVYVQRVLDEAIGAGLSARTVVQVHRIMHAAFRQAVRWQLLAANPSDGVTPPKIEAPTLRIPDATDVSRLLAAVGSKYRTALALAASTGARRGEVLAVRWSAVDLDSERPTMRIEGTLQRANGVLEVYPPKTARSRRVVPLPASMAAALKAVRVGQAERRLLSGPAWSSGDFVFDRGDGRPIDPDALGKAFRASVAACGLDGIRLHDLRHGFASMMIAARAQSRVVSDLLGHATVGLTLQVYTHPNEADAAAAAETAERLFGPALA